MTTELERRLRAGMERVEARVPHGLAAGAYRRYRRRRLTFRALAAAGTAVVVASAAAAVASARADDRQAQETAYLASRVSGALAQVSGDMLYTRTTYTPPGSLGRQWDLTIGWSYQRSIRNTEYSLTGRPYWDTGITRVAGLWSVRAVNVDYPARNFMRVTPRMGNDWSMNTPIGGPIAPPIAYCSVYVPPTAGSILDQIGGASTAAWAKYFKAVLDCGQFRVAGHQRLGGTETIKLVDVPSRQRGYRPQTVWVDPSTYLPVAMEYTDYPGTQTHTTFEWLPPTKANLANLNVPVPAGFKQVKQAQQQQVP
jgi:hypothetical protein